jgi:hypothetical protein
MSRNSKTRRNLLAAREMSKIRAGGGKGPKRTTKKTTKRNTWFAKGRSNTPAPAQTEENNNASA